MLAEEVKAGRFRADLYHRLSVYPLHVAPLRERIVDIAVLARYFLNQARVRLGLVHAGLAAETVEVLQDYRWPGNVRELEHVILRAVLRASSIRGRSVILEPGDLDLAERHETVKQVESVMPDVKDVSLSQAVDEFQRQLIRTAYLEEGSNWSKTARRLGVDRGNLHRLAKRLAIK
jgi:anaerobic nitric oxide reductase transcription regulator